TGLAIATLLLSAAAPVVDSVRLENQVINLEVTPALGGRGLSFSLKGRPNLLKVGEPLYTLPPPAASAIGDDIGYLGHDVWVGPQEQWWTQQTLNPARRGAKANWPPDPYLAFGETRIIDRTPTRLVLEGEDSPVSGVRLRKTYELSGLRADTVEVQASARNIRDTPVSWDLWFNTRTPGSTRVYVPVTHPRDARVESSTGIGIGPIASRVEGGLFSFDRPPLPAGMVARRGKAFLQPSAGWMAGFSGRQLFVIRFPHHPRDLIHPAQGQVELYLDDQADAGKSLLEMEVHAPYRTLAPGEEMHATESWTALAYDGPDTREAQVAFLCEVAAPQLSLASTCDETKATHP
ncbi:MAG TPA: DUF4380 domain-containing protein, partial [Pseudoxanthomonas sp.]|nr:DUF4380 domain-containing protein [Pseudoxanthomonas sp.]